MSPTVRIIGPYRFFFFANEAGEPPHIHVERDRCVAKLRLRPVAVASSQRFPSRELRAVEATVVANAAGFLEAWHEFFPA
jgi:hypothetical protein